MIYYSKACKQKDKIQNTLQTILQGVFLSQKKGTQAKALRSFLIFPSTCKQMELSLYLYFTTLQKKSQEQGEEKKMKLMDLTKQLDNLIKEKQFLELKANYILKEIENTPLNNLNEELKKIDKIKLEINAIMNQINNCFAKIEDILKNNFDDVDIKIYTLKKYKNLTYEKIAELINYSTKQTQRRYKKIMEFEIA